MAFKKLLLFLFTLSLLSLSLSSSKHHRHRRPRHQKIDQLTFSTNFQFQNPLHIVPIQSQFYNFPIQSPLTLPLPAPSPAPAPFHDQETTNGGEWVVLQESIGISAMHMQLLYNNKIVIFDRTDFGVSNLSLPDGKCRFTDDLIKIDCSAHSVIYDVNTNTYRPLMVQTDVWCSSGVVLPDGVLLQTGGYLAGAKRIRSFSPCDDESCDWIELEQNLTYQRWYASNHILPDGRVIIVGGRRAFSYEFFPKDPTAEIHSGGFKLPFLEETSDSKEENNLYPFLHLLPDGSLFIFANQRSVLFDYISNRVIREFPTIPDAKRSYPATGSSVLLPIKLVAGELMPEVVEVMICGGSYGGAYLKAKAGSYVAASSTCGRLKVSDPDPKWVMENMPLGRVMPDMLLLPTSDIIILNGAGKGTGGWELADDPVLHPVLYSPTSDPEKRFRVLKSTATPRMYHSAATLLPDGRILVGGSNPHILYNFTDVKYPTDLSLEAFSPPYLSPHTAHLQPSIISVENPADYGQEFAVMFEMGSSGSDEGISVLMIAPSFTTHSFAMNQRLLLLDSSDVQQLSDVAYKVTVYAPPSRNVAPPGYYMLFVVHDGVPSHCVWIKMK